MATKADITGIRQEMAGLERSLRQEMGTHRWIIGLNLAVSLAVLGVVVAVALRVFDALPK